jgi:hypothetical protein
MPTSFFSLVCLATQFRLSGLDDSMVFRCCHYKYRSRNQVYHLTFAHASAPTEANLTYYYYYYYYYYITQ